MSFSNGRDGQDVLNVAVGFPGCDTQCPSVISYPADVPCPGSLPSSDLFNHVCDLCLFSYQHVCFSVPVYDV